MDSQSEFWWDRLERLVLLPRSLPPRLSVAVDGATREWRIDPSPPDSPAWTVRDAASTPPTARQTAYLEIARWLHGLHPLHRDAALESLRRCVGGPSDCRADYRPMTADEVHALHSGGLVTIGAHTVTHPRLSLLSEPAQHAEMLQSKRHLERVIGTTVRSFAYPTGQTCDFTRGSVEIAREVGFEVACTAIHGGVCGFSPEHELRRLTVGNWPPAEFRRRLAVAALSGRSR